MRTEAFVMDHDWRAAAETARRAEDLGFDYLSTAEISGDPFLTLAHATTATSRIGLRTGIAVAFPRSPMIVAQMAWDLQRNSGGRFSLGLGTQVKGHNERRFSVPWAEPARRLREYVESLRAIWATWRTGVPLAYQGSHYRFSLMTPEFTPPPIDAADIPVYIAAVRPAMMRLAGRVCDGVRLHGFCTGRYLREVAIPNLEAGLREAGRARAGFEICGGGFVITGKDDAAVAQAAEAIRYRVAFYGSTRTYGPVLSLHGWDDLSLELHRLSKEGRWDDMAKCVTDDVLQAFTVMARHDGLAKAITERFGSLTDSIELGLIGDLAPGETRELLQDIRRIPATYTGERAAWA